MLQETKTVNPDRLCGRFTVPAQVEVDCDHFETSLKWPEDIAHGMMKTVRLRPGLTLGIGNFKFMTEMSIPYEMPSTPVMFGFCLHGNIRYSIECEEGSRELCYKAESGLINFIPEHQGVAKSPPGITCVLVGVYIDASLLHDESSLDWTCKLF